MAKKEFLKEMEHSKQNKKRNGTFLYLTPECTSKLQPLTVYAYSGVDKLIGGINQKIQKRICIDLEVYYEVVKLTFDITRGKLGSLIQCVSLLSIYKK